MNRRMAHEMSLYSVSSVEVLLEWKDHEHLVDVPPYRFDSSFPPGPELGRDEIADWYANTSEAFRKAKVEFGEIYEKGDLGAPCFRHANQPAECENVLRQIREGGQRPDGSQISGIGQEPDSPLFEQSPAGSAEFEVPFWSSLGEGIQETGSVLLTGTLASYH